MMHSKKKWLELVSIEAWVGTNQVFKDLSLSLSLLENTVVLGPNGSGKSTLVKLINRSIYPVVKAGSRLKLFGSEVVNLWSLRSKIGFLSTELEARVDRRITARDLVLSGLFGTIGISKNCSISRNQINQVNELMRTMDLIDLKSKPFSHLSDGQRRRVLIARSLVHQPEVLILDEPTKALDLKATHQLLKSIRKLCQNGTTLVQITHQVETIIPEMNRVIFLKNGKILSDSTVDIQLRSEDLSNLFETPLQVIEMNGFRQVFPA